MSTETSARLGLPMLAPGQAQKELFHNEALARIDLALQASVLAVGLDAPPAAERAIGDSWVVGNAPAGEWSGQAGAIAGWTAGGWRFVAAIEGMAVWDRSTGTVARHAGGSWGQSVLTGTAVVIDGTRVVGPRQPGIAAAQGGATVDGEVRAVVAALLAALRTHGLIER